MKDNPFALNVEPKEYTQHWTYSSGLQKMIYIPSLPYYYRERAMDEEPTFKEKAWTYFVRATLFALLPFASLIVIPFAIYGGAKTILEAKTFRGFWND